MNKWKKNIFIFLITFLFSINIAGCSYPAMIIQNVIKKDLKNRYGIEFEIDSITRGVNLYHATCHPKDDPDLRFTCMYGDDGSFGYDYYIGMLIAREEEAYIADSIGDGFGQSMVHCTSVMIISDVDKEFDSADYKLCELIKNGSFSIKDAYQIKPIREIGYYIFVNETTCTEEYADEYDVLKKTTDDLVDKYNELYGLDLQVNIDVFFLDNSDYEFLIKSFETDNRRTSQIMNNANPIRIEMGIPKQYVTEDLWLTKDEYIEIRKEMNK